MTQPSVTRPCVSRPRDQRLERELTELAALSAGITKPGPNGPVGHDYGLRDFADKRAWPGGVRSLDFDQEIGEELADASNYCLWAIERIYARVLAQDVTCLDDYERWLRVLAKVIAAWRELRTVAA